MVMGESHLIETHNLRRKESEIFGRRVRKINFKMENKVLTCIDFYSCFRSKLMVDYRYYEELEDEAFEEKIKPKRKPKNKRKNGRNLTMSLKGIKRL